MTEPGGFVHDSDPFATPAQERAPARRFRGRLPAAVTLWTAPGPAGLTVSSTLVAEGEPAVLVGLVDEESELWGAVRRGELFAVVPLRSGQRRLADRFAGLMPAPGGLFKGYDWRETRFGPVPVGSDTWVGCRLAAARPLGWGLLVEATVVEVELGADGDDPLVHFRGRYRDLNPRR